MTSPSRDPSEDLRAMSAAADAGARVLVEAFAHLDSLAVESKSPANFVSAADRESELAIREVLAAARPEAAFRGEESGYSEGASALEWVVDPLDGTTNFLCGVPHFAVSIALREADETVAALILQPLTGERFTAARGHGAQRNGEPMRVSTRARWDQVVLATGVPHRDSPHHQSFAAELATIRDRVGGVRRFGAAALDLAWVAWGRFDGYWERGIHPWDVAAGNLLVREAGGVVTGLDPDQDPDTGRGLVAATPWLQPQLLAALRSAS
ncbi:inositol monophosphatase [Pseudenhygromyxa sp. WMMC2535]|uniref:inositol monophosphatase family protein n=1 Tax=Pseudenhygromyxa sp. WMMC2535 TaxID=2712867 RepID=UPI0015548EE9|nr:inositol monophosphatase family protein [Pseudenhygromyxa sp. WMMC2535]NVB43362.1 inositol monophosphatase [Pseudenhygromyxa sp. WMMC2535]